MWGFQHGIDDAALQWVHNNSDGERQLIALGMAPLGISSFSTAWMTAVGWSFIHNYTRIQIAQRSETFSSKSGGIFEYIT